MPLLSRFFGKTSPWVHRGLPAVLAFVAIFAGTQSIAQVSPTAQCGEYVEAYKAGPSGYNPYLQAASDVAKSRDAQRGVTTYSKALQASASAANALWLNNWCTRNPLKGFTEASSRLLDELTGQTSAPPGGAPRPQIVVVAPPQPLQPSACKVGDVGDCQGCAVSCGNGSEAKCKRGSTFADGQKCAFQAKCECQFSKNSAPPQEASGGVSSCRVGYVGDCSGCSVTCNNGQSPVCKPGSTFADGQKCAFQSKCSCK
jgi:hypothetical protein